VLVAIVMATGLMASCSGNDSDAAGESTQPSITTTTTAGPTGGDSAENATTATPTLASGLAGWSDPIDLPPAGNTSNPQDVVVHGDQLVAVGAATFGDTTRGAVWRSADQISWDVDATAFGEGRQWPRRVVSFGDQLVAIGYAEGPSADESRNPDAIGWTSTDGISWQRIDALPATAASEYSLGLAVVNDEVWIAGYTTVEGTLSDYQVAPDGTVLGPDAPEDLRDAATPIVDRQLWGTFPRPLLIRSTDGTTWEEVALPGVGFAEFHAVASTADGLPIVAGADAADRMAVWRQGADGAWTRLSPPVPADADRVYSLGEWHGNLVVGASDGSGGVHAPGGTWTTLPAFTLADLVDAGDRLVTVGWSPIGDGDDYQIFVAESVDATAWSGVELPTNQFLVAATLYGDGLVAVGSYPDASGTRVPAMWTGGSPTESVAGEALAAAPREQPEAPTAPIADVLSFDGTAWTAELANDDLLGAALIKDMADLELDRANDLVVTDDGAVWVATERQGVFRLSAGTWTHFGVDDGLPANGVRFLAAGPDGTVVAASVTGPAVFDGATFRAADLPAGIADPRVIDLAGDGSTVWAATGSGLVSWDGSEWYQHGAADGLPTAQVIGGELPAGLAKTVYLTDDGVIAEFPGVGLASWAGSSWTVLDVPHYDTLLAVGWDGSAIYGLEDGNKMAVHRWHADGSVEPLGVKVQFGTAALGRDGTVWITDNLGGIYEVRGGSATLTSSPAGVSTFYVGRVAALGDQVFLKASSGMYVHSGGAWSHYAEATDLDYPLGGHDNSFSTGAIYALAIGPDGRVWALSRESLPEWADG